MLDDFHRWLQDERAALLVAAVAAASWVASLLAVRTIARQTIAQQINELRAEVDDLKLQVANLRGILYSIGDDQRSTARSLGDLEVRVEILEGGGMPPRG